MARGTPRTLPVPVADNIIIYKGAIVQADASGYASNAAAGNVRLIIGIAAETIDNTLVGHTAGGKTIEVEYGREYLFTASSITQVMLGVAMLVIDNNTIDDVSAGSATVGRLIQFISVTQGWVFVPGLMATP
jgi:hypothetical protein